MQVSAGGQQAAPGLGDSGLACGAVADVEDEVARAILAVADEGAARRILGRDRDRRDIHSVGAQAVDVEPAEIVVADAGDDAGAVAEPCHLVDEDGGRAGGERAT